jgi:hypothetical protein
MRFVTRFFTAIVLCTSLARAAEPGEGKKDAARQRLEMKMMALKVDRVPLKDAVDLMNDLAGSSVCLDRAAFDAADIDTAKKLVSLNTKDGARLGDVLKAVAAQLGTEEAPGAVAACGEVIVITTEKGEKPFLNRHRKTLDRAEKPDAKKLKKDIEATFSGVGFSDTLDFLRDVGGVEIVVDWNQLEQAGVEKNHPIDVRVHKVTLAQVIQLMIDGAGANKPVGWSFDGKTVRITQTPKEKDAWPPAGKKPKKDGL